MINIIEAIMHTKEMRVLCSNVHYCRQRNEIYNCTNDHGMQREQYCGECCVL